MDSSRAAYFQPYYSLTIYDTGEGYAPSYATVKMWVAEFKRDRESLEDDPRSGRSVTVAPPEIATEVHDMVMDDRRVTEIHS